jgi:hypothetical protein
MIIKLAAFADELEKLAIGQRQWKRIQSALDRMGPAKAKEVAQRFADSDALSKHDFPIFSESRGVEKVPIRDLQRMLASPNWADTKQEILEALSMRRLASDAERRMVSGRHSARDIVDIPSGRKMRPGKEGRVPGFLPNEIGWKGGLDEPMDEGVRWISSMPSVAKDYAQRYGAGPSSLRAYRISGVPKESIGPWTQHLGADTRNLSPEEIAKLPPRRIFKQKIEGSPLYERVISGTALGDPVAIYKPLPSGKLMRTKGPNILVSGKDL